MEKIHAILKAISESPSLRAGIAAAGITIEPEQPTQSQLL
jgi:hypothetical protein